MPSIALCEGGLVPSWLRATDGRPNRSRGRATLMPVHFGRDVLPCVPNLGLRSNAALPCFFRDAKSRCRSELHRSGRGGSTPPSCRGLCRRPPGLQTLTVKSRLLTGENSVRIRVFGERSINTARNRNATSAWISPVPTISKRRTLGFFASTRSSSAKAVDQVSHSI